MSGNSNEILAKRFKRLAVITAFLLALLWALGSFVVWILGGITACFVFLAIYYSPRKPVGFTYSSTKKQEEPSRASAQREPAQPLTPQQKKRIVFLIAGIAGVIIFVSVFLAAIGLLQPDISNPIDDQDRQTLVNDPDNLDALTNIGNRFYTSQQYDSALYYYNRVLEIDQQNSSGLYNKSLVYYQKQQYDQSISTIKKCIELYPNYGEAHAMLGDNYYVQNNYSEALRWYRKGYDKGVRSAEVLNIMGYLYEQQGNTTEAVRFYKEVLQQDSSWVDVYDKLIVLEPGQAKKYQQLVERWR